MSLILISLACLAGINASLISLKEHRTPYGEIPPDGPHFIAPCLQWTGAIFKWPSFSTKELYKNSGQYISKHIIATRGQMKGDDLYLALPRFKCGVPATLVRTTLKRCGGVKMEPFPCWSMQSEGVCKAFQSVTDIVIDHNNILWALDTGIINSLQNPLRTCPPKVVALSVTNGHVLKSICLGGLTTNSSRLQNLAVDYGADGRCFVYVSDAAARAIIVYDVQASKGYRVILPKIVLKSSSKRDVLYLALVRKSCGNTFLYFTYLSSKNMFSIKTEYLRTGCTEGKIHDEGIKPAKMVIIGTDQGSAIFFRIEGEYEVYRWDTVKPFIKTEFQVVYRSETCQLATHALADYRRERMMVLESNFPDFLLNTVGCGAIQQLTEMKACT